MAMLEFAEFLTVSPSNVTAEAVDELRNVGWTDEDIVDITHITALFNLAGLRQVDVIGNADGVHLQSTGTGRGRL